MLTQFQHDHVACIGYIESVFFQVLVAYEHRSFHNFYSGKIETLCLCWSVITQLQELHTKGNCCGLTYSTV